MRRSRLLAALAATAVAGSLATIPVAEAAAPTPKTLVRQLLSPLSLAVDGKDVYVSQNFAGVLNKLRPGKDPKVLYASQNGNEVGGVSVRKGSIVFAETASDPETGMPADAWIKRLGKSGKARTVAHVRGFEEEANPDGEVVYGLPDLDEECLAQWPEEQFGPASYTGVVDSHPYATFQTKKAVYVADAGMNAILAISKAGRVRTVAVTPRVPVEITAELAGALEAPECIVGHTYYGESVPTDVQMKGGRLYVTTEGGFLGESMPLGALYRVDPRSGALTEIAGGLMAPTGLAATSKGKVLVAELFGNRISRVSRKGEVAVYAEVGLPGSVEVSRGKVYATIDVLPSEGGAPDGKVVRFRK